MNNSKEIIGTGKNEKNPFSFSENHHRFLKIYTSLNSSSTPKKVLKLRESQKHLFWRDCKSTILMKNGKFYGFYGKRIKNNLAEDLIKDIDCKEVNKDVRKKTRRTSRTHI
jgi:hypothetical protein